MQDQHWSTLVGEQRRRGLSRLRFSAFVEEQFRQHYAGLSYPKVRPLLVLAALGVIVITGLGVAEHSVSAVTATFGLAVMMPLLMATLIASYQPERHLIYQHLLAVSALCVGLIVTSVTLRAGLHGTPYFFGAEIAWIFTVWAILGLRSFYFMLAGAMAQFDYLKYALAGLLVFIGAKMIGHGHVHLPNWASLAIIAGFIAAGVIASLVANHRRAVATGAPGPGPGDDEPPPTAPAV